MSAAQHGASNRGAFITIEGIEGVGKSTSMGAIRGQLERRGLTVVATREPGGTPFGESVRELILHGRHERGLAPETEALLMFAARAEHLKDVIRPALEHGHWVICDRFTDATLAYQGAGRGVDPALLAALRGGVQRGLEPDLTLWLDAPVEVGRQRIGHRTPDHFERETLAFFERVRSGYERLAREHAARIQRIDAAASQDEVLAALERAVDSFVDRWKGGGSDGR